MGRLTIFAKGNLDVRDTLHSLRLGGDTAWNGINEVLRVRGSGSLARVRHETWARSDVLLQGLGRPPADLAERGLPLGAQSLDSQFSQALFETDADAIVLSVQPDVHVTLARHREDGVLFYPNDREDWPAADQAWLRETCVPVGLLGPDASMANFARIIERIRQRSDAPILIYNLSSVVPGEQVHRPRGPRRYCLDPDPPVQPGPDRAVAADRDIHHRRRHHRGARLGPTG